MLYGSLVVGVAQQSTLLLLLQYRSEVYTRFKQAESGVLLCTDVAARGLDIQNVHWIVQLCPPASTEDYVHRLVCMCTVDSTVVSPC